MQFCGFFVCKTDLAEALQPPMTFYSREKKQTGGDRKRVRLDRQKATDPVCAIHHMKAKSTHPIPHMQCTQQAPRAGTFGERVGKTIQNMQEKNVWKPKLGKSHGDFVKLKHSTEGIFNRWVLNRHSCVRCLQSQAFLGCSGSALLKRSNIILLLFSPRHTNTVG